MSSTSGGHKRAAEHWDDLFEILSAHKRRMILFSLLNEPKERRLPLPAAAVHSVEAIDTEEVSAELRHRHLPKLAEEGLVRWERGPLCVQRGPHFEDAAFLLEWIVNSPGEVPSRLVTDCNVLGGEE